MNIPVEQFIPTGAGLLATIVGLMGVWFKFQEKVERLEEDKQETRRQIDAFWKWKDEHEKTAMELREKFNREIAALNASMMVTSEQFKQIVSILNEIKDRIQELEKK